MAILGIDLSKTTFDATLLTDTGTRHHRQFPNTATGFHALHQWLHGHAVTALHACMEATNIYWEALADDLFRQGYQVSVVNPARTKGFALSQLQRNKTDKVDSGVIADFCARLTPALWTPPSPEARQLRDLVRHLDDLKQMRTQQTNRQHTCQNLAVQASLQAVLTTVDAQIEDVQAQIQTLTTTHATLRTQRSLLESIPGIGTTTAVKLLAEMPDLAHYQDARAAAADAGLTPAHFESGVSVRRRPRLSKLGKATIRGALYWPAKTAMRYNPFIRRLKERLDAAGKPYGVIVGAAMRKLLHLAYGVLKHQQPFDAQYVRQTKITTPQDVCQLT